MSYRRTGFGLVWFLLLAAGWVGSNASGQSAGTALVTVQLSQPGAAVSSNLFGIFFEEINYAGDGGLYAELVRNRSFAASPNPDFWTLATQGTATGTMTLDTATPLNTNSPRSLKLTFAGGSGSVGAANGGYWGVPVQTGAAYDLSFYARATNGFAGPLNVRVENADGTQVYSQYTSPGLSTNWQRFKVSLVSGGTDTDARIVLRLFMAGTVWLDEVSLFPHATFMGRTNGLRADLANMLAGLRPSFLRYPGGNFIESNDVTNAVRWKKTVGELVTRPGHQNDAWGYWSTDGYGLDEFFRQCEDMGMEPLYGINCGLMLGYNGATNNTVPLEQMGPWVQDALDLVEYANGDTNTVWGALRANNGHPAPYGLKYLEIGNENGGPLYDARYTLFYDALKTSYPEIRLISPVWGNPASPVNRPVEIRDEHYYANPATFISYASKYDTYNRDGPKVFVGEYAVTSGYGAYGNLSAALGEAAFMTGMERNSDIVELASYAPLFANVNGIQWHPDLIYYDNDRCFGTPSYYVQQLFGQHRGDVVLPSTVTASSSVTNPPPRGAIGLGSWSTSVQYSNIVVTSNGVVLYQSDFVAQGTNGWRVYRGNWSTNAGLYQQTSASTTDCRSTTGDTNWAHYTLSLKARKVSGSEGFLILFNWTDDNNWTWLNLGGWGNTLDGIEQCVDSVKTTLGTRNADTIITGAWYDILVVLTGPRVQCYLNGSLIQDVTYATNAPAGLFASSTYHAGTGQILLKVVNPYGQPMSTTFDLAGADAIAANGTLIQLTSPSAADENSLAAPTKVFPTTNTISGIGTHFTLMMPANSLSVLRLNPSGIRTYTNLQLQVTSPINVGDRLQARVWGQLSGNWTELTQNTNHSITYDSTDRTVAAVDSQGNITAVGPGATQITASYASLGLSARQTVQVIGQGKALMHRYSFNEPNGSTSVVDSVSGPAWNGLLPKGGTLGKGQLALAATAQQYVQFPAGMLSNYPAVTVESWVTFFDQLPVNCFFYGFGDTTGSSGLSYIFCAPRAGRTAITGSSWSGEQNAYAGADFSFRTNLHLVAVYNPPAGYISIWTNGMLAGMNCAVTTPMVSVNDLYGYIGKSLYSGDPYPDLLLDEFRLYCGALDASDIAATDVLGPEQVLSTTPPTLSGSTLPGYVRLSWPAACPGYHVQLCTNLAAGYWTDLGSSTPQLAGIEWQVLLTNSATTQFYRLKK